ncbi:squalene synthase HpnC [Magnetospirillum molischianum]|uniref:Putative phytoene synthase n=1 Tax=Magnetospirillum molischianum DSM 120 TaxID=1150626 RepID=H8FVP9_MAGML|nr:squalene synthase HpnC [Magnetospirillum molischianum]CCG42437.1 putative phytoene synthase [Magnetospirillum molischianum DSM 120]
MEGFALTSAAAPLSAAASKTANEENFPVASLLLHKSRRATVMAYYHFARHADDVADSAVLTAEEKVAALDALEAALRGTREEPDLALATAYRHAVSGDPDLIETAAELLNAFRRDALRNYCTDWSDLMSYCRSSAAPVGRFLLTLHGESPETFPANDALCAALQVLNHLQDCGKDLRELNRVYVPVDLLTAAGLTREVLRQPSSPAALRTVLDQMLDQTDGLIANARPLVGKIRDIRLRLQTAITVRVAEVLSARLRTGDPLATRVKLSPLDYAGVVVVGVARGLLF